MFWMAKMAFLSNNGQIVWQITEENCAFMKRKRTRIRQVNKVQILGKVFKATEARAFQEWGQQGIVLRAMIIQSWVF